MWPTDPNACSVAIGLTVPPLFPTKFARQLKDADRRIAPNFARRIGHPFSLSFQWVIPH
jgi:hypothetical protein